MKAKKPIVVELDDETWQVTRPCCGAVGLLKRPAASVIIKHKEGCPYERR